MKLHLPVSLVRALLGAFLSLTPAVTAATSYPNGTYSSSTTLEIPESTSATYRQYKTFTISGATSFGIYILESGYLTLRDNGSITIVNTKTSSSGYNGYGVCLYNSTLTLSGNASLTVMGNGSSGIGSRHSDYFGTVSITDDGDITVSDNGGSGISVSQLAMSGNGTIRLENNQGGSGLYVGCRSAATSTVENNGNIFITSNSGCGIGHDGTLVLSGNKDITIIGNGSDGIESYNIVNCPEAMLFITDNGDITVSDNGGSGISRGIVSIANNGEITVSGNGGAGIDVYQLTMSGNGAIRLENNKGTGLYASGTVESNGDITITGNTGDGLSGSLSLLSNASLTVTGNSGSGISGGIVSIANDGEITVSGNGGSGIAVSQLTMSGNGVIRIENNQGGNGLQAVGTVEGNGDILIANNGGYGIYNSSSSGTLAISDNGAISITGNSDSGIRQYGSNSVLALSGNTALSITDNEGIGISNGTVSITNDGDITVSGNGGAGVIVSQLTMSGNGVIRIENNQGGNGLQAVGTVEGNGDILIANNGGYGIYNSSSSGTLAISDNGAISITGNSDSGIRQYRSNSVLALSGNTALSITDNGGIGISNGTVSITNDGDITVSGNGGAGVIVSQLTMSGNGAIRIENNQGGNGLHASGTIENNGDIDIAGNSSNGLYNSGTLTLSGNGDITISGNGNYGLYNASIGDTLNLSSNGHVLISGHTANDYGAGLCSLGTANFDGNQSLTFRGNTALNTSGDGHGGAIYASNGTMTSINNHVESVLFEDNSSNHYGGAISLGNQATLVAEGNQGSGIRFAANSAGRYGGALHAGDGATAVFRLNDGGVSFSGNTAGYEGGALHLDTGSRLNIDGNGSVLFDGNTATLYGGGAIAATQADITISGNTAVSFLNNTAGTSGGALYSQGSSISITGNEAVTFRGNLHQVAATTVLNALYAQLDPYGSATLAAPDGGTMDFYDPIVMRVALSGIDTTTNKTILHLNSSLNTETGAQEATSGTIRFSGAYTEADLLAAYERAGVAVPARGLSSHVIAESRTSRLNGYATLYGGELHICDQAKVVGVGFTMHDGATLRLSNGGSMEISTSGTNPGTERVALTARQAEATLTGGIEITCDSTDGPSLYGTSASGRTAVSGMGIASSGQAPLQLANLSLQGDTQASAAAYLLDGVEMLLQEGVNSTASTVAEGGNTIFLLSSSLLAGGQASGSSLALDFSSYSGQWEGCGYIGIQFGAGDSLTAFDTSTLAITGLAGGGTTLAATTLPGSTTEGTWATTLYFDLSSLRQPWDVVITDDSGLEAGNTLSGNLTITQGGSYTLGGQLEAESDPASEAYGQAMGNLTINDGSVLITGEGSVEGSVRFTGDDTAETRQLAVERDRLTLQSLAVDTTSGTSEMQVEGGATAAIGALNGAGDLAKTGSGTLEIAGAGDHSGTLMVQQGSVSLTGDGQLSSDTIVLGSDASAFSLRRVAARSTDAPLITTDSGISISQNDSSRTGSLSGHEPLSAQGTAIIGQADQRAVADNVCISLDNAQATFTLGNLDLNNSVMDVNAAAGLILHDLRLDATSQVSNRADVLAQMTGQNSVQLGSLVSITGNGQLSTEQLYGVELTSTGSLTLGMDSDLLAAAGLTEGSVAELWLAGLQVADTATLSFEDVLQADGLKLAITIQAIEHETDGTRLQIAVAAVPEPTTATLTLLALTALAARRRRGLRPVSALRSAC